MFDDYKKAVSDYYLIKKDKRELSTNLENPGRDKLRRECVAVFVKKNSKKDKEFIQSFFDPTNRFVDQIRSIEKFNLDKFRPLINFLTIGTNIRDEEQVKLLAWLLGFHSYEEWRILEDEKLNGITKEVGNGIDLGKTNEGDSLPTSPDVVSNPDNGSNTQEGEEVALEIKGKDIIDNNGTSKENGGQEEGGFEVSEVQPSFLERFILWLEREPNAKKKKIIVALVPIALTAFGAFAFFEHISAQCMYWTGNEYQSVGCSIKVDQATVIALDKEKLINLKKINRLDTITEKDLGKVWYVKIKQDSAEFYTDSGTYPLNPKKRLMPMTPYILNKYILRQTQ